MSITLARLRAFLAVIEHGSFAAAAERLGFSQPSVAQAVRELEADYKVTLFIRRGTNQMPTAIATELAKHATEMLRLGDAADLLLRRRERLEDGVLRIGLGNAMPGMSIIGRFQRRFPQIQLQVGLGSFSEIIAAVEDRQFDVGVLPNVPTDGRFRSQVCLTHRVVALVHESHPLGALDRTDCAELIRHQLIFRAAGSSTQRVVDAGFRRAELKPRPMLVLDTRDGVCEAVANGLGVGFIWRFATSRTAGCRKLDIAEFDTAFNEVVFHRADQSDPVVDAFCSTAVGSVTA